MCGIAGFFGTPATGTPETSVQAMTDAIAHRGPDADGHWCDHDARIALGHRRLSIIDLTPLGAQPMHSASGRYVIAFNGEAYNYAPLRTELGNAGYPFKGHSDTEVLLAAAVAQFHIQQAPASISDGIRKGLPRIAKRGFAIRLAAWLRGPLRAWADDLLSPRSIADAGLLDVAAVRRLWTQHLSRVANHGDRLWTVLALQAFVLNESQPSSIARPS